MLVLLNSKNLIGYPQKKEFANVSASVYLKLSMTCRQNTPRKFFAHLTADKLRAPQPLCFMYPFGNTVPAKTSILPRTKNMEYVASSNKIRRSVNTFKHDIKKLFSDKLQKDTDDIFIYY